MQFGFADSLFSLDFFLLLFFELVLLLDCDQLFLDYSKLVLKLQDFFLGSAIVFSKLTDLSSQVL